MKQIIKQINDSCTLYRDDKTGIAWVKDESSGCLLSVHPSIDSSGSVTGMKRLGYWGQKDRVVHSNGFKYNIDRLSYDKNNAMESLAAKECRCIACTERRSRNN